MGIVIAVVVVVAVVAGAALALVLRRRRAPSTQAPTKPPLEPPAPMVDLETALNEATDRTGRNMRERIEAGSSIDDLRVPDDTGPVLRRALDHVEHAGHEPAAPEPPAPTA